MKRKQYIKIKKLARLYLRCVRCLGVSGNKMPVFEYSREGVSGLEAFLSVDTYGKRCETRHLRLLTLVMHGKACLNFHIKMWSDGLGEIRLNELKKEFNWLPTWVWVAVLKGQRK